MLLSVDFSKTSIKVVKNATYPELLLYFEMRA